MRSGAPSRQQRLAQHDLLRRRGLESGEESDDDRLSFVVAKCFPLGQPPEGRTCLGGDTRLLIRHQCQQRIDRRRTSDESEPVDQTEPYAGVRLR